jgi:hypothetical protein
VRFVRFACVVGVVATCGLGACVVSTPSLN